MVNNESFNKVFGNIYFFKQVTDFLPSYPEQINMAKTCKIFNQSIRILEPAKALKRKNYLYVLKLTDTNKEYHDNKEDKTRILYINDISLNNEITFLESIKKSRELELFYEIRFRVDDHRKRSRSLNDNKFASKVAPFIDKLFDYYVNASILDFMDYSNKLVATLNISIIRHLKSPKIKIIRGIDVNTIAASYVYTRDYDVDVIQNLKNLQEFGICKSKVKYPLIGDQNMELLLPLFNCLLKYPNLIVDICGVTKVRRFNKLWSFLMTILLTKFNLKTGFSMEIFREFESFKQMYNEEMYNASCNEIVELKVKLFNLDYFNDFIKKTTKLTRLSLYIMDDSRYISILGSSIGSLFARIQQKCSINNLKECTMLKDVFIGTEISILETCRKPIQDIDIDNFIRYLIKGLPKSVSKLTISYYGVLSANILLTITEHLPHLKELVIYRAELPQVEWIREFGHLECLYLNTPPTFQIPRWLQCIIIEYKDDSYTAYNESTSLIGGMRANPILFNEFRYYTRLYGEEENNFQIYCRKDSMWKYYQVVVKRLRENIAYLERENKIPRIYFN
uniref:F-box domain-containing protein n=1 Tax=Strongyloides papillosus TaxID=174720 RepID=A0A0N5BVY7_STREA